MNRRNFLLGAFATSVMSVSGASKAFAQSCDKGAFFSADGKLCDISFSNNAPAQPAQQPEIPIDDYFIHMHHDSDVGYVDAPSVMVRPAGVAAPRVVPFQSPHPVGALVVDHVSQYLYHIESSTSARRYPVCVGREGRKMINSPHEVFMMRINPIWQVPNSDRVVPPGPENALGVRAIYLCTQHDRKYDAIAIHGTNNPSRFTLPDGKRQVSLGCVRMLNPDVADLYSRLQMDAGVYPVFDAPTMARYLNPPAVRLSMKP